MLQSSKEILNLDSFNSLINNDIVNWRIFAIINGKSLKLIFYLKQFN